MVEKKKRERKRGRKREREEKEEERMQYIKYILEMKQKKKIFISKMVKYE